MYYIYRYSAPGAAPGGTWMPERQLRYHSLSKACNRCMDLVRKDNHARRLYSKDRRRGLYKRATFKIQTDDGDIAVTFDSQRDITLLRLEKVVQIKETEAEAKARDEARKRDDELALKRQSRRSCHTCRHLIVVDTGGRYNCHQIGKRWAGSVKRNCRYYSPARVIKTAS